MSRVLKDSINQITVKYSSNHKAVDVVKKRNQLANIIAHSDGEVIFLQTGYKNNKNIKSGNATYGNCVKIKHKNGYSTLYAHMSIVYVKKGQKVKKGQIIGYMGDSGYAIGKHLHFEVRNKSDQRIDPTKYIDNDLPNLVTVSKPKISYYKKYTGKGVSIVEALKSIGIDSSFSNRSKIAKKNGIKVYLGTASQNTKLLTLLKQGKLVK